MTVRAFIACGHRQRNLFTITDVSLLVLFRPDSVTIVPFHDLLKTRIRAIKLSENTIDF